VDVGVWKCVRDEGGYHFYRSMAHLLRAFLEEEKEGLTATMERTE